MSGLVNQHWIGLDGEPVTGRVPPSIRMMAGVMTPEIMAEVAHRYYLFSLCNQASVAQYFVANKKLPDGSRIRIVSNNGNDVVMVWSSVASGGSYAKGGFICRPTNSVNTVYEIGQYRYWGKPYTEANKPLGTPMGTKPFLVIQPKQGQNGTLLDEYKVTKGLDGAKYGQIDWQGDDVENDVLSWSARSWDRLTFNTAGQPQYKLNQWEGGDIVDYEKSTMMVHRCRNHGTGRVIYSKLSVIKEFADGVVEGACLSGVWGGRTIVAVLRVSAGNAEQHRFINASDGDELLGSYMAPANTVNLHGWYFNKAGTKARCTFASKMDQYAVEATISTSGVTFSDISGSRTSSNKDNFFLRVTAPWNPPISKSGATTSNASSTTSGSMGETSPAFYADYFGDDGVIAVVHHDVATPPSISATYTYTPFEDGGTTETFEMARSAGRTRFRVKLMRDNGDAAKTVELSAPDGLGNPESISQVVQKIAVGNGNYKSVTSESSSATVSLSTGPGTAGAVLDVDARTLSILHWGYLIALSAGRTTNREVTQIPYSATASEVYSASASSGSSTERVITSTSVGDASSELDAVNIGSPAVNYTGIADGSSGAPPYSTYSPATGGSNSNALIVDRYEQTLAMWQSITNNGGSSGMIYGAVRSYGAKVCSTSTIWVGGYYQSLGESAAAEKGFAHIIPAVDGSTDATIIVNTQDQPIPWLAKLGVI